MEDDQARRSYRQIVSDAAHAAAPIRVTDDCSAADIVIVPADIATFGLQFQVLRRSALFRSVRTKAVVYSFEDLRTLPLPGVYAACARFWSAAGWALPAHYRSDHLPRWQFSPGELSAERDLLFSFVGEYRTHPVRGQVGALRHPRSSVLDSSPGTRRWWDQSWEAQVPYKERFREYLCRSKFVLCPRGVVPNSIRIYEAMEAGAVPVLISDGIVLPRGPRWEEFSVRIRERDVASIPEVLESLEPRAAEMGAIARREWEEHFSPTTSFRSLATWAATILKNLQTKSMTLPWLWAQVGCRLSPHAVRRNFRDFRAALARRD